MDNLVLIRVAADLERTLRGSVLTDVREDATGKMRLLFEIEGRWASVGISLQQELPWLGRPWRAQPSSRDPVSPFTASAGRLLRGRRLRSIEKPSADRRVTFAFSGGPALVLELTPHAAEAILLDERGVATDRSARRRDGEAALHWEARPRPAEAWDPFVAPPEALNERLGSGGPIEDGIRRMFGIGRTGARLVAREAELSGRAAGAVLAERLSALLDGRLDPCIEAPEVAGEGESSRLLPWDPPWPPAPGWQRVRGEDAAATSGDYHEAAERSRSHASRRRGLLAVLEAERRRALRGRAAAVHDGAGFADADRWRLWGEALLAGLRCAERIGSAVRVPDPYGDGHAVLLVPVEAGVPLTAAAQAMFQRHRRARRGSEHAAARIRALDERLRRLDDLLEDAKAPGSDDSSLDGLERAMREIGLPVGLERRPRRARPSAASPARLPGVRLYKSREGWTILVGRGGRENQRLTFHLAGPEDFWFHALGVPGAHVVLRNDERIARPPEGTLREAAAAAAWFSDARKQPAADVQWTRRKYVRKARGAAPGTVRLKRFETIRVAPSAPPGAT